MEKEKEGEEGSLWRLCDFCYFLSFTAKSLMMIQNRLHLSDNQ